MTAITNSIPLILQSACYGAYAGAAKGAKVGISIVSATLAYEAFRDLLERASGNEPREPLFDSFISFTVCAVGVTTLCGMLIRTVSSIAITVFNTWQHSDTSWKDN
jgi:hypothetical protein